LVGDEGQRRCQKEPTPMAESLSPSVIRPSVINPLVIGPLVIGHCLIGHCLIGHRSFPLFNLAPSILACPMAKCRRAIIEVLFVGGEKGWQGKGRRKRISSSEPLNAGNWSD
jgi:hypothetical protein